MKVHASTNSRHFVVIDVKCDCCGGSCKSEKGYEFMSIVAPWKDGKLTAQICRKCVEGKLFFINFKKETWDLPNEN